MFRILSTIQCFTNNVILLVGHAFNQGQEKAVFEQEDGTQQVHVARPAHPLGKYLASVRLLA